jgi:SAM-dependent methyltransferase
MQPDTLGPDGDALRHYYDRRAREYEAIYRRDDPVRQAEQRAIQSALRAALTGKRVLEIACGTGYWTQVYAGAAEHVVATDAAAETLAVALEKRLPRDKVEFRTADAYALDQVPGEFDAGVALFWLSHVPQARLGPFLAQFHARLGNGAVVLMADNVYIPGLGGELITRPGCKDTFKRRLLADGSKHEILKNYYTEAELRQIVGAAARELRIHVGTCFWWLDYRVEI